MNIFVYLVLLIALGCVIFQQHLKLTDQHLIIITAVAILFVILFSHKRNSYSEGFAKKKKKNKKR